MTPQCPGFVLVEDWWFDPTAAYDGYNSGERPRTRICTHEDCQYDAEYMYAFAEAISLGEIRRVDFIMAKPRPYIKNHTYIDPTNIPNYCEDPKEGCSCFVVCKNFKPEYEEGRDSPYDNSYTRPCIHAELECDPTGIARWTMIHLIQSGHMDAMVLRNIDLFGWSVTLKEGLTRGEEPTSLILKNDKYCDYLWRAIEADNWATFNDMEPKQSTMALFRTLKDVFYDWNAMCYGVTHYVDGRIPIQRRMTSLKEDRQKLWGDIYKEFPAYPMPDTFDVVYWNN